MGFNPFKQKKMYIHLYKPQLGDLISRTGYGDSIGMLVNKHPIDRILLDYKPTCEEDCYLYDIEWLKTPAEYMRGSKERLSYYMVNQYRAWYEDLRKNL